jgi:hypothetical protein
LTPLATSLRRDLLVLVPDQEMRATLTGVLTAHHRLQTRKIDLYGPYVDPHHDSGVYLRSQKFLRSYLKLADHCLVVFDRDGCGSTKPREQLESEVEGRLSQNGWAGRSAAIVIDPELENWVWSDSPQVETVLGWPTGGKLKTWLVENGYLRSDAPKPRRPKEAFLQAIGIVKTPRSSSIYFQLAQQVSFQRCTDPAFIKLKTVLLQWFPRD